MTPSQKKEIEKRFREFWTNEYVGSMRAPDPALIFFFSILDQVLAEQREELRRIFDTEIEGIKNRGALTPCGETTLKILEEIKKDLLKSLIPQQN